MSGKVAATPAIAVGIPTYDRPQLLREALASVFSQTYANFEVIVSNDNPDRPLSIDSLGVGPDPRLRVVNQPVNLGELANMNWMLSDAKTEWFCWLNDDDLLHPELLAAAADSIGVAGARSLVAFYSNYISSASPDGRFPRPVTRSGCVSYSGRDFIRDYTARKIRMVGSSGVMRTRVLREVGGIRRLGNSFGPYGDTLIPIVLAERGTICWLDEPLVFYRAHPDSVSHKATDLGAYTSAEADFLDRLEAVCESTSVNIDAAVPVAGMMKWFSQQEWTILSRSPELGLLGAAREFVRLQLKENFPRLSFKHRIAHIFYTVSWLNRAALSKAAGRISGRGSSGQHRSS